MEPAVHFQTSALVEHCSGQKRQDSIAAEMIRRTSIFQEKLDERMYQSNRSFNIPPPRAYPGHLMSFPAREGGNLINLVFPGAGI